MKKFVSMFVLLPALSFVIVYSSSVTIVRASSHIRAGGSVYPDTAPIQRDGNVYTFTGNYDDSNVVEREKYAN